MSLKIANNLAKEKAIWLIWTLTVAGVVERELDAGCLGGS